MNGNDNVSLDLEMANGWDVQDMFRKNEQEYGVSAVVPCCYHFAICSCVVFQVQSTFDHSLRGYTVPLQTSDTPDFREAHAKATQIAQEIGKFYSYFFVCPVLHLTLTQHACIVASLFALP